MLQINFLMSYMTVIFIWKILKSLLMNLEFPIALKEQR